MTSPAISARPSSTSSVQRSSYTRSETANCLKSPLSCAKSPYSNLLGYLLAISFILIHVSAAEDAAILTSTPGPPWPLNEGPPGLGDSIMAITIAICVIVISYSVRKWHILQDPFLWGLLVGVCSFVGFFVMGDPRISITSLLR